jgi:hypothetical protein
MAFLDGFRDKQAENLMLANEQVRQLRSENHRLKAYEPGGKFYLKMQKLILDNEILMDRWQEFCLLLKLVEPDMDNAPAVKEGTFCKTCCQPINRN